MRYYRMPFAHAIRFLLLLFFSCPVMLYGQAVAGIKANGVVYGHGDTINVCKGNSINFGSAATGSVLIQWTFNGGSPASAAGIGPFSVTYNTVGYDTASQLVDDNNGSRDSTFVIVHVSDDYPVAAYSFSPDNVCGNIPIQFTNASTGQAPLSYAWNFNDNTGSTTPNPSHTFLSAVGLSGTQVFNVQLVVTNASACKDTATQQVTIIKVPDATMTNAAAGVTTSTFNGLFTFKHCAADLSYPFQFNNGSTTTAINVSYTIKWGDGSPDSVFAVWPTATTITHVFPRGNSIMTLTVTGMNGCLGIKRYNVFLGTSPVGSLASQGSTDICISDQLTFNITGVGNNAAGTQYSFSTNDGMPRQTFLQPPPATVSRTFLKGSCGFSSNYASVTYNNSYSAYLIISNPCGTIGDTVVPIYVSGKPRPAISIAAPVACTGTSVHMESKSGFGSVVTTNGTNTSTCVNTGKTVWEITPATYTIASGSIGSFNGNPNNGAVWTSGTNTLDVNFSAAGTYTIKLSVSNGRCGDTSVTSTVCVRNPPQASFTMSQARSCVPATVDFTNTSPSGGCQGDSYLWDITYDDPLNCGTGTGNGYAFVNGSSASSASPSVNFSRVGRYAIRLTTSSIKGAGYCQKAFAYDTFYITAPPVAALAAIADICVNNSINPVANVNSCYAAGPVTYQWTFAGGTPATATGPSPGSILYSNPGNYPVQLVVNDPGCSQSATANTTVMVIGQLQASFTKDRDSICAPATINFTNTTNAGSGISYTWDFGNGTNSSSANPLPVVYAASPDYRDTTYYITLNANNGCPGIQAKDSVTVLAPSQARFAVNNPKGCSPFTAVFINSSRGDNTAYYWDFGDGQADTTYSTGTPLSHTYITGTIITYTVRLIADGRCQRDTQTINLQVAPNSIQVALQPNGNQLSGCAPHTVTFNNASTGAAQMTWDFGDGSAPIVTPGSQQTVTHVYQLSGNFTVTVHLQNDCSDTTVKRFINVYGKPVAGFTAANSVVCTAATAGFTNTSQNADSYQWTWGDGSPASNAQNAQHNYTAAGAYTVTLIALKVDISGFVCSDTFSRQITVVDRIAAVINQQPATPACAPYSYTTMAANAGAASSVEWIVTNTLTQQPEYQTTGISMAHVFNTGSYQVTLVVHTTAGCEDRASLSFTVYNKPILTIAPLQVSTCNHDTTIVFTATPAYNGNDPLQYNWFINGQPADAGNPFSHEFIVPASSPDISYLVQALATNAQGCGDTSLPVKVNIYAQSVTSIQVSPSTILVQPDYTFGFQDLAPPDPDKFYTWDMGDKTLRQLNGQQITYQYGDTGTYKVKLYVVNRRTGCNARDSVNVQIIYVPGYLYVPNAMCMGCSNNALRRFLPLGKGLKTYRLRIYNNWGQIIFESTRLNADGSPDEPWNGTMNGKPLQQDAYTWQIEARYRNGTEWKGMIYPNASKPVKAGFIDIIK